jgi:TolA-binding protein
VDDQTVIAGNLQDKKTGEVNALGGRTTTTTEEKEEVALSMEPTKDALTFSSKAKVPAEPTAYDEYFAGNYKTAATKFEDIVKDNPSDLEAKYYLGLSNFNSNKLNKAISSFDEILAQPDNLYTDGAIWYKAQSLIKKGKEDEALPLLQELSSRENSYKQSASEKIFELDD